MIGLVAALAAALALASAPAPVAGDASSPSPVRAPQDVVVTAIRPKDHVVEKFVQQLAAPAGEDDRITRWNDEICSGVTGLSRADAEYFNDRLAEVALKVGLKVGEPGCTPNIVAVITPDVKPLMQELSRHRYVLAGFTDVGDTTSGGSRTQTFDKFIAAPRPVNWWHISERVTADGGATIIGGVLHTFIQGRMIARTNEELRYVLIVVDAHQTQGVALKALANYVAMASLAQLNPEAPVTRLSSIMTLFADRDAGRTPPEGMTSWDIGYLKGLYAARTDAPDALGQRGDIVRTIQAPPKVDPH